MISTLRGLRKRTRLAVCALVAGIGLSMMAEAASAALISQTKTLQQLLPGGTDAGGLILGDKKYSGFTYASVGDQIVTPSAINVTVSTSDNVNYSIKFNFGLTAYPGENSDLTIGYRLDVVNSTDLIGRLGLVFNGALVAPGSGGNASASISELVRTVDGSDINPTAVTSDTAILTVYNDGVAGLPDNNSHYLTIIPKTSLFFEKNILVNSRATGGAVHVSIVDNLVEQVSTVPEPTSLLGIAALSAVTLLRRHSGC